MLSIYFFSHLLGFAIFVTSQKKCGCTVTVAMSFYRLNYLSAAAALFLKQTNATRAPHSRRNLTQGKLLPHGSPAGVSIVTRNRPVQVISRSSEPR